MDHMMDISMKLKNIRKGKNMSQEELAELSGIHVSTVKKYECGIRNPKPAQLKKIAQALDVSIHEFLFNEITTTNDIIAILIKLSQQTDLRITADQDDLGSIIPSSIQLSFKDLEINEVLSNYLVCKKISGDLQRSQTVEFEIFCKPTQ